MEYLYCLGLGYLLGSLSPAALISKIKNKNLKETGTKNLGATNTMLVFGRVYGILVMVFDIAKSFVAVKLAELLFPSFTAAGIIAGSASVAGHIFPFYLKFRGGKGLASYGGMILALDPLLFLILLLITLAMMFIVNYGVAMPMSAAVLFPVMYGLRHPDTVSIVVAVLVSLLLIIKHIPNIFRIQRGEDSKIREWVKERLHH